MGCQISEITYFWSTFNNKLQSEEEHFCVEQTKEQKKFLCCESEKEKIYCEIDKDKYYKKNNNHNQICTYAKPWDSIEKKLPTIQL